ncbi:MAG: S26 family signal peptidase [Planctomycetota bacterium]|jgi:type IV secretory pathway protease TraF
MSLETVVRAAVLAKPISGGKLIERLQAEESDLVRERAVLVYGALANLRARGEIKVVDAGPGEVLWGAPDAKRFSGGAPGFPPSFALGAAELELVDRELARRTRGLPRFYFEELRRVVVADADRRVFNGARLPQAVTLALADLGPESAVRRFLRRVERGRPVVLSLRHGPRLRWLAAPLALVALFVVVRLFVCDIYTIPAESISMAPTLVPAPEGGDVWVLAGLYARWLDAPRRGEVWIFDQGPDVLVKRVWGLPGETVSFDKGDLVIDGARLVKERALLDRVQVPLCDLAGFTREGDIWRQTEPAHSGWQGGTPGDRSPGLACRDVAVRARIRIDEGPASVTFVLKAERRAAHSLLLRTPGLGPGEAAVAGIEVARGEQFRLEPGREREVWLTNADRLFRVEIDGRQLVREPIPFDERSPVLTLAVEGGRVRVRQLEVARDLIHEAPQHRWTLADDEYFVLGDNSAHSRDSRHFDPIARERLKGRVLAVAWPPGRARRIR